MAVIKYLPAEIDGVEIITKVERLLQAIDVHLDSSWNASNVNDGFDEVYIAIQNIDVGEANLNQILTSGVNWQVLVDSSGNVLSKGFI